MIYARDRWYYDAETLWADRVWVHKHYLEDMVKKGVTFVVTYQGKTVEIPPTELLQRFDWCKPTKHVENGEPVGHCGMLWQSQ